MASRNWEHLTREEALALTPKDVGCPITLQEFLAIARKLGAYWAYDYDAADEGRPGMHAELKSGLHSNAFLASGMLWGLNNIAIIMARQIVFQLLRTRIASSTPFKKSDYVVGIPDGATRPGELVAVEIGSRVAQMKKTEGVISLETEIPAGSTVLLVEDVCTRGTAFAQAVRAIKAKCPGTRLLPYYPVLLNRGGIQSIKVDNSLFFVISVVERRFDDWLPEQCPLCKMGSKAIKPKATDENWRMINASQLP